MRQSSYRSMWLVTMFDLPVDTKMARRHYAKFRKFLLEDGFMMLQFSVYGRHCPSEENAEVHCRRVRANLPPDGEVRLLSVTDRQFERMQIFYGKMRRKPEQTSAQLTLF